jgi:uncharacterized SAM-binding protein YcdF (DUF218 family)
MLLVGCSLAALGVVKYRAAGPWLVVPPNPHPADAIVILGLDRTDYGIKLFKQGMAPEIWHTGWNSPESDASINNRIQAKLQAAHIPHEAVHLLTTSSTWEDGEETAALARQRGVRSILVVTDWYHSRRALCVIRHHLKGSGVDIYYAQRGKPYPHLETWWKKGNSNYGLVELELKKLAYYFVRYGLPLWEC